MSLAAELSHESDLHDTIPAQASARTDDVENQRTEAQAKRAGTLAFNAELLREDVLSMYRRGGVPLMIAGKVKRSEQYVLKILLEADEVVPRWLRNDLEGCALRRHDGNEIPPL